MTLARHITFGLLLVLPGASAWAQQADSVLPTEVLHSMIQEMLAHPERPQGENTMKFVSRARTKGLDDRERLALGEVYFLAFMPEEAREIYQAYLERNDDLGRLAWQRLMRITFAAESKHAEAEQMLEAFYRKFRPTPLDEGYGSQMASDLARHWRSKGDNERAIGFILREYNAVSAEGAYVGLSLPARMSDLFAAAGRLEEAKQLTRQALEKLKAVAERDTIDSNPYQNANRGINQPHRAGTLHNAARGLIEDVAEYDRARYVRGRIYSTIRQLEGMLARLEQQAK